MHVLSISGFAPYWQRYPVDVLDLETGPTIGGGEEAFIRTATGLAKLGHKVEAFHYGDSGTWRGVKFYNADAPLYPRLQERWDAVLSWSSIKHFAHVLGNPVRLLCQQLNDLWCQGDWSKVDCVVSPSHDHTKQLPGWGWKGPHAVVHNGLDPELYTDAPPWNERPLDVGYWSSPDRGLHHLLKAWPLVHAAIPQARLHVFYEIKRFLQIVEHFNVNHPGARGIELGHLVAEASADSSITFHGAVPRRALARVQKQCRVMCYPYDPFAYCEGFGGAVNQGLAAGCTVMTTPRDAFPTLYAGGVYWLQKDPMDLDFVPWLAERVVSALRDEIDGAGKLRTRGQHIGQNVFNWDNAALEMERAIQGQGWKT